MTAVKYELNYNNCLSQSIMRSGLQDVVRRAVAKCDTVHRSTCNLYLIKLITEIQHSILDPLSHIINLSFSSGVFPDLLKIAKVVPIYKKRRQILDE